MNRTFVFLILACLTSCLGTWDLSNPVFLDINDDVPRRGEIAASFDDAILQLGGKTDRSANQRVRAKFDPRCDCPVCGPTTVAYASRGDYSLIFCESPLVDAALKHELLHALAHRADHLPCETGALMTADTKCQRTPGRYSPDDIRYACDSGYLLGGACSAP